MAELVKSGTTSLSVKTPLEGEIVIENIQLQTYVDQSGIWSLSLVHAPLGRIEDDEVLVRVEAAPINPSDISALFGPADVHLASLAIVDGVPVCQAPVSKADLKTIASRLNQLSTPGNEGAGTVIRAGKDTQALLGKTVALFEGGMYARFRKVKASSCLVMHDGTDARTAASAIVNPMTALAMLETMRRNGHRSIVHAPAASNLGTMLVRLCLADGIGLVNIVRSASQAQALRAFGAKHICNSSEPDFHIHLSEAIRETGATIAFDAIGGGELAGEILAAMESVAAAGQQYNRYGSSTLKQVFIYGSLNGAPTIINRSFGMAWTVGGWVLHNALPSFEPETVSAMRARVVNEIGTTFKSNFSRTISLRDVLDPACIAQFYRRATGEKFLIDPWQ